MSYQYSCHSNSHFLECIAYNPATKEKVKGGDVGEHRQIKIQRQIKTTNNIDTKYIYLLWFDKVKKRGIHAAVSTVFAIGCHNERLDRYVKLRVAHAPGMPRMFSPPPRVSDPDLDHGTCVTHVSWCMLELLTSGFLWSRWRWKRSRHSRRMLNPQFYVSGKRPMQQDVPADVAH